jgi:hypothetical protein
VPQVGLFFFFNLDKMIEGLLAGRAIVKAVLPIAGFAAVRRIRVSRASSGINRKPYREPAELFDSVSVASRACIFHGLGARLLFAEIQDSAIVGIADELIKCGAYPRLGIGSCCLHAVGARELIATIARRTFIF